MVTYNRFKTFDASTPATATTTATTTNRFKDFSAPLTAASSNEDIMASEKARIKANEERIAANYAKPIDLNQFKGQELTASPAPKPQSTFDKIYGTIRNQVMSPGGDWEKEKALNERVQAEVDYDRQNDPNFKEPPLLNKITSMTESMSFPEKVIAASILPFAAAAPVATASGIAIFSGIDMAIKKVASLITGKDIQNFSDVLPQNYPQYTKDALDVLGFVGEGFLAHGANKAVPGMLKAVTKNVVNQYKMPEKFYVEPAKIRDMFQTGKLMGPEEAALVRSLGLDAAGYKNAMNNGVSIDVPSTNITTITDKPYWAKLKTLFRVTPTAPEVNVVGGKPTQGVRGFLTGGTTPVAPPPVAPPVITEAVSGGLKSPLTSNAPITPPLPPVEPTPVAGPGHQRFSNKLDTMVQNKTILTEDANLLREVFKDTNDEWIGSLNPEANPYIKRSGNANYARRTMTARAGSVNLAKTGDTFWNRPDIEGSMILLHEYGHLADKFLLNNEERAIVGDVYRSLGKPKVKSIFAEGMSETPEGSAYYAKNQKEFLVQSLAEYVFENKVPSEKMKPLLERLAVRFFNALKSLVNRKRSDLMKRLTPIFEKMLSGEKNSPLSKFMEKEPASFKQQLQTMLAQAPATPIAPPTKAVPPVSIFPPEAVKAGVVNPPVEAPKKTMQEIIVEARKLMAEKEAEMATTELPTEFPEQAMEIRDMAEQIDLAQKLPEYKDLGNVRKQLRDIFRNTEAVFGKDFPAVKKTVLDPLDKSKGELVDFFTREIAKLNENVTEKFKFNRGTKESAAIEMYGEGKATKEELIKEFGPEKAQQIIEADAFFRDRYNTFLDNLNRVEMQIYPNSPYKWTPKLKNYYRHGHDLNNDFSRLQNILENPIRIDPMLSGISQGTEPKSKWASFKQRRLGGDNKNKPDAIGGFLDYMKAVGYSTYIDPNIGKFRELADVVARGTEKSKNLNDYIYNLRMFANELAGKTPEADRIIMEHIPGGRTTLKLLNWLNNRVKANTILGNMSSAISQIYNIPQGIASTGVINSSKALVKTLGQVFVENKLMQKSTFLKERYFKGFNQFDKGMLNNTKKMAAWLVTIGDEVGSKFIWNGQYEKAIKLGAEDPIKFADDATRKLVAGRGIGEKPLLQNSQAMQIVAPFQLEVTNLWWAMEDIAKTDASRAKKVQQIVTLMIALWMLNNITEPLTGNRIALDPIDATLDGIDTLKNEPNLTGVTKAGGRLAGEVLSNVPFGQTLAAMYPEFGTTVMGMKALTRAQLFGAGDPTRFGGGLMINKAMTDPLFKILPPMGGAQLKKAWQGITTVDQEKSTNISGDWQYYVEPSASNYIRGAIFGKSGLPEAQTYYKDKQTKATSGGAIPNRFRQF
jgi:hypothetical protein